MIATPVKLKWSHWTSNFPYQHTKLPQVFMQLTHNGTHDNLASIAKMWSSSAVQWTIVHCFVLSRQYICWKEFQCILLRFPEQVGIILVNLLLDKYLEKIPNNQADWYLAYIWEPVLLTILLLCNRQYWYCNSTESPNPRNYHCFLIKQSLRLIKRQPKETSSTRSYRLTSLRLQIAICL